MNKVTVNKQQGTPQKQDQGMQSRVAGTKGQRSRSPPIDISDSTPVDCSRGWTEPTEGVK